MLIIDAETDDFLPSPTPSPKLPLTLTNSILVYKPASPKMNNLRISVTVNAASKLSQTDFKPLDLDY